MNHHNEAATALSNRQRVEQALDLLNRGLLPFVERESPASMAFWIASFERIMQTEARGQVLSQRWIPQMFAWAASPLRNQRFGRQLRRESYPRRKNSSQSQQE